MAEIKISNPDELGKHLTEQNEKVEEIEEKLTSLEAMQATIDELKTLVEAEKQEKDQFAEKIKTLTLAVKARGSWKEETQEGKDLRLSEFVQAMLAGAKGTMRKLGGVEVKSPQQLGGIPANGPEGDEIPPNYKGGFTVEEKALTGGATTPMRSDTGDTTYYGQYLVPIEYKAELWRAAADASAMMGLVTTVPMRGVTAYIPTTTDAFALNEQGITQDTDITADTLTLSRATLTACNYYGFIPITEEYDQDSLIALGAFIRNMFSEAWATLYDTLCLEHATYGVMANTINSHVMGAGSVNFSDMVFDDLSDVISELTTKTKRNGAMFFMHPTVLDVIRKIKNAQGDSMWQQPTSAAPGLIWGIPYRTTDGMPSLSDSAAATQFVLYGNPRTIVNGQRLGFEFKIFDQTQSTMVAGQIYLRCRLRQAFVTVLPLNWADLTTAAS